MRSKGLAPATVRAAYLTLGQVLTTAEVDGLLARSPMVGTKQAVPKETSREEMHFLSGSEIELLGGAITPRFRAAIYAAGYLGLRVGELWAVKTESFRDGTLRVEKSLAQVHGGKALQAGYAEVRPGLVLGPTKTGRFRSLLVPRFLLSMLDDHLREFPASPEGFAFTSAEGGPVWHRNFYARHFKPAVVATDLPRGLRFHYLRHSSPS